MSEPKISSISKQLGIALIGVAFFRLPYWILQFAVSRSHGVWPWHGDQSTWCIWDCNIYTQLSQSYSPAHSAFFPLFPAVIHGMDLLLAPLGLSFSPNGATLITSNLFVLLAGVLFLYYAESMWPEPGKQLFGFSRKSWLALLLLSVFPEGHFWMRGYSEPLFFSLLMGILLSLKKERWIPAGVLGGLIGITRPQGLWVVGACGLFLLWRLAKPRGASRAQIAAAAVLFTLPFLGFMAWLWAKSGNPFYFYAAQTHGWGRHFSLIEGIRAHLPRWDASHLYLYVALIAAFRFLRRPVPEWVLLGGITLMLADLPVYFGGFYSYVRFASINPGIFLVTSELTEESQWASLLVVGWCLARLALQMQQSVGGWAG